MTGALFIPQNKEWFGRKELLLLAGGLLGHGREELVPRPALEVVADAVGRRPEAGEVGVGEQVLVLPLVHHLGTAHAVSATLTVEVLAVVDALVIADRDATVVVTVAVDDPRGGEALGHDALLPASDEADERIADVEPLARAVVGQGGLLFRLLLELEERLDLAIDDGLLLDELDPPLLETLADAREVLVGGVLEVARGVELPLFVGDAGVGQETAGRRDHVVVTSRASTRMLAPPAEVERGRLALTRDRGGVDRLEFPRPVPREGSDLRERRLLVALGDLDDRRRVLPLDEVDVLLHLLDVGAGGVGLGTPVPDHLTDRDFAEEDDVVHVLPADLDVPVTRNEVLRPNRNGGLHLALLHGSPYDRVLSVMTYDPEIGIVAVVTAR